MAWALTEDEYIFAVVFDEELAHEIATEYDFDISEIEDDYEVLN